MGGRRRADGNLVVMVGQQQRDADPLRFVRPARDACGIVTYAVTTTGAEAKRMRLTNIDSRAGVAASMTVVAGTSAAAR